MSKWYANELSKLTQVSVRTLHHYDRIDLLKPSLRLSNSYRLYSEKDLLKLQQIIALKFFGFNLSQIKTLLTSEVDLVKHFSVQSQLLQEKAKTLLAASDTLNNIISDCGSDKSIPWKTVIKLIEVYRMTQQIENSWVSKILDQNELKQYLAFEQDLKTRYSPSEKAAFEQAWLMLVAEIKQNLNTDPTNELGIDIGKRCMTMINGLYGKEHLNLRTKIWHEGFKKNQMGKEHALSPQMVAWLDKAISAYWRQRIYAILAQVKSTTPPSNILILWNEVLEEMYGDAQERKNAIFDMAMKDDKISQVAKDWLKKTFRA